MTFGDRLQHAWWEKRPLLISRLLQPLATVYRVVAALHRCIGTKQRGHLPVPVIVVGNLIVGGAGKTPVVIAMVQALKAKGYRPAVISRGYGRAGRGSMKVDIGSRASEVGDEPLLIRLRTGVPVYVDRDRASVARRLCSEHPEVDILVSDDGLQHWRLPRSVEVIVFDDRGAGNGLLLPAGPLRGPLPVRLHDDTLVLYNAPGPTAPLPGWQTERALAGASALEDWWQGGQPRLATLHALKGREVWAVAGIAAPGKFFAMLEAQGLQVRRCPLPDHHGFDHLPWPSEARDVVVTEKDAVKLRAERIAPGTRVWVVTLDLRLPSPMLHALLARLPAAMPPRS
ncbi:MAG TPA: tetraacyldisaccharide 4'-kinase [Burkholderiaceae bacterium]|nr:tetraacyldisaccharide 4'-kinase [Burkholderiaceae bacterium]